MCRERSRSGTAEQIGTAGQARSAPRADILEQFIEGKHPSVDRCEDALYRGDSFVAVIDGATNTETVYDDGRRPGRIAAELLISALAALPPDVDARTAVLSLDRAIADWYRERGILDRVRDDVQARISASAVILSLRRREIWMIGDCQSLIGDRHITNHKRTDSLMEEVRAFVNESELAAGATVDQLLRDDTGRAVIDELIRRQRHFQNGIGKSRYNYFVLDGFLPDNAPILVHALPDTDTTVVLASDGYPRLRQTLQETEAELKRILTRDPLLCGEFKSTKGVYPGNRSFDDRSYIRIRLFAGTERPARGTTAAAQRRQRRQQ